MLLAVVVNDVELVKISDHARSRSHALFFGFGCRQSTGLQVGCQEREEELSAPLLGAIVIAKGSAPSR